ncbi:unnamed protein product [Heligmosomoides polygyrus]|uniref:Uncharacterized protein n=1 Tax=Heligmosomoides polygyrus TaxID=6339 RepID=A0A183GFZ5_HELPZ|nr:unnamed protein product [Heligmosomoides polygyrus]
MHGTAEEQLAAGDGLDPSPAAAAAAAGQVVLLVRSAPLCLTCDSVVGALCRGGNQLAVWFPPRQRRRQRGGGQRHHFGDDQLIVPLSHRRHRAVEAVQFKQSRNSL